MLEVTITDTATEEKWTLQGRLVWPWVNLLRENWRRAHRAAEGRTCIVDLNEVRFIDESGERMLRSMANQGAQLVASSVDMKRVLERLRSIDQGVRPWADNSTRGDGSGHVPAAPSHTRDSGARF
ncbi:MAG: hypothetical protein WBC04_00910 [Candidatus Acidiferrales bacterium]